MLEGRPEVEGSIRERLAALSRRELVGLVLKEVERVISYGLPG